jgi:hypothetical protein
MGPPRVTVTHVGTHPRSAELPIGARMTELISGTLAEWSIRWRC